MSVGGTSTRSFVCTKGSSSGSAWRPRSKAPLKPFRGACTRLACSMIRRFWCSMAWAIVPSPPAATLPTPYHFASFLSGIRTMTDTVGSPLSTSAWYVFHCPFSVRPFGFADGEPKP